MTETSVDYFGFTHVGDKTPLVVHAPDEVRETLFERHGRDGVIFTEAQNMPSLEALLEAHQVGYTFLQLPAPFADEVVVAAPSESDWRNDASTRLEAAVEDASKGDAVFHADYSFVPGLTQDDLDGFLEEAHRILRDAESTDVQWEEFLRDAAHGVAEADPPILEPLEAGLPAAPEAEPLLTVDDLQLTYSRGAIGGPAPLVHSD